MLNITERTLTTTDCGKLARIDQWRYTCDCCSQQVVRSDWKGRVWHWFTCKLIRDLVFNNKVVIRLGWFKKARYSEK